MRREVFVRGVGAVSALGLDWTSTAAALARGESAISRVEHFDVEGFPCQVAAPVRGIAEGAEDRRREFALRAAREAWTQARVTAAPERMGVFLGAESGRASFSTVLALAQAAGGGARFDHAAFGAAGARAGSSHRRSGGVSRGGGFDAGGRDRCSWSVRDIVPGLFLGRGGHRGGRAGHPPRRGGRGAVRRRRGGRGSADAGRVRAAGGAVGPRRLLSLRCASGRLRRGGGRGHGRASLRSRAMPWLRWRG